MKRISNLYDKIIDIENLRLADKRARKGKTNTYGVVLHDKNREENILLLHETLRLCYFRTSEYNIFTIKDPKEREIYCLPYYPDRILHHAIMNVMEPIWVSAFIHDTYACVKGRGISGAHRKMVKMLTDRNGTTYCLKMDIKKFYPSIDHDILKSIIRKKIKCKKTLALLDEIIDSAKGLPIGNYLSQHLANLYLTYFDHFVKEVLNVKYYIRYADDIIILNDSKGFLHGVLVSINSYLVYELNLELKKNYKVFSVIEGIDFIGYVFYHTHIKLRKRIKRNLLSRISAYNKENKPIDKVSICGWIGWLRGSNSINLCKKHIKHEQDVFRGEPTNNRIYYRRRKRFSLGYSKRGERI